MNKNRNRLHIWFAVAIAAFVATSLLESLPLVSASTSTAAGSASPSKGRRFFGRSSSSKKENSNKDASVDDDDEDDKTVEKTKKKSSWQFFHRKNEDTTITEHNEGDQKNGGKKEKSQKRENKTKKVKTSKSEGSKNTEDGENESTEKRDDGDDAAASNDASDSRNNDNDGEDGAKTSETDGKEEEEEEKDDDESEDSDEQETSSGSKRNPDYAQQYRRQLMQQQQQQQRFFQSPGIVTYRSTPRYRNAMQPQEPQPGMPGQAQVLAAAAVVNLLSLATRVFFVRWIINKLALESESKSPVQHFMWECLNDKFVKDDEIWNRVLSRVPLSKRMSQRKWDRTVKAMGPDSPKQRKKKNRSFFKKRTIEKALSESQQLSVPKNDENDNQVSTETKPETPPETSKTVVVMDFSTMNVREPEFLRFADVVTFLVSSNSPQRKMFGKRPEIILTLQSGGGEVTSFAFAAAQVARLREAGWNVTVCVDRIAASGGYMIASQATQILASPFAMVGSVGVITESLNFYEILKKYGIQSLVLKAGDNKNPITQFGKVTDEDIKTTQENIDETHQSFIELCRSRRPGLDPAVCNGRILSGDKALERGMIDRILTSDEYILEKISEGDLVMRLHLVSGNSERHMIANALQILPHLTNRFKNFVFAGGNNSLVGKLNSVMDGNFASTAMKMYGLFSMTRRAIMRARSSGNNMVQ